MLDLCFIVPDSDFLLDKFVIPNLTPILLKSYLIHNLLNKKIKVIYLSEYNNDKNEIPESKYYGISFLSPHINEVKSIYSFLKNKYPSSKILVGGPHVNAVKSEVLNSNICDYFITGFGEEILLEFLKTENTSLLNNIIPFYKKDFYEKEYENIKLDYSDININKYSSWLLMTDVGCPYHCSFCFKSFNGIQKFSYDFIRNCVEDFTKFDNYQSKLLKLTSDNVLLNFGFHSRIFNELFKKYNISYEVVGRLDLVNEEKLNILKTTGCKCIKYGVESGSPRMLKLMNKGESLEQIENGLKLTEKMNMPYGMYFIVNYPGETQEDLDMTIKLINKYNPKFLAVYNFTPYPGSPIWNKISENERQKYIENNYSEMYHAGKEILHKKVKYILDNTKRY